VTSMAQEPGCLSLRLPEHATRTTVPSEDCRVVQRFTASTAVVG